MPVMQLIRQQTVPLGNKMPSEAARCLITSLIVVNICELYGVFAQDEQLSAKLMESLKLPVATGKPGEPSTCPVYTMLISGHLKTQAAKRWAKCLLKFGCCSSTVRITQSSFFHQHPQ